jgi:hypothetical protein
MATRESLQTWAAGQRSLSAGKQEGLFQGGLVGYVAGTSVGGGMSPVATS